MEEIKLEQDTEIISSDGFEIVTSVPEEIKNSCKAEIEVTFDDNEYSIVGDDMVVLTRYEDAPQWMKDVINGLIDAKTAITVGDLDLVKSALSAMLDQLEVAKNTYELSIISTADIDSRIVTKIETLNSTLGDVYATILDVAQTYVTPSQASAIALSVLQASLSEEGAIGSAIINLQSAYASLEETSTSQLSIMEAAFGEHIESTIEEVSSVRAYAEGVESKFAYNSNLKVNGVTYESGFGLATSLTADSGIPVGDSEFWIKADKFRLTSAETETKSAYNPFTVDSNSGEITFNGKVSIEGMPSEVTKFIGNFYNIEALNSYLIANPDVQVNEGDTYRHTGTDVVYMWTGTAWTSTGAELVVKSMVFKRSNTMPDTPIGGTYEDPTPEDWEDGIPYAENSTYAAMPVWASVYSFSNKVDYAMNPPEWSTPVLAVDSSTVDYMYNSSQSTPTVFTNTSDSLLVSTANYDAGWRNESSESSAWMAVRVKNAGVWSEWEVIRVKGEVGSAGSAGPRGSLLAHASGTVTPPSGTTLNNAITSITGSQGIVKAGDVVIWTNTTSSGGTEIYTYNGTSWNINTALKVNGNAIIEGTIFANRIATYNLTSSNATIGNLVVGTISIKDNAITDTLTVTTPTVSFSLVPASSTKKVICTGTVPAYSSNSMVTILFTSSLSSSASSASVNAYFTVKNLTKNSIIYSTWNSGGYGSRVEPNYDTLVSLTASDVPMAGVSNTYEISFDVSYAGSGSILMGSRSNVLTLIQGKK
jgi:hypothetical protein